MLEQGIAEGVPGPRGPAGEPGLRGPGIVEVTATSLPAGADPTATLQPLSNDPEGDLRLELGLPPGADGATGPRGPGITDVAVSTLPAGADATATLQPIAGDPEGDLRLQLGIPRGEQGPAGPLDDPELTHIIGLSWAHDEAMPFNDFLNLIADPDLDNLTDPRRRGIGLVIMFDQEVQMATVLRETDPSRPQAPTRSEVFQLYARTSDDQTELLCECLVPRLFHQPVEVIAVDGDGRIVEIAPRPGQERAKAVRLVLPHTDFSWIFNTNPLFLRIVFRADFALDLNDKAVDGNHIGGLVPNRPSGNGRQGDTFESWFTVPRDEQ
jgi:hypothetical protein